MSYGINQAGFTRLAYESPEKALESLVQRHGEVAQKVFELLLEIEQLELQVEKLNVEYKDLTSDIKDIVQTADESISDSLYDYVAANSTGIF